MSPLLLAICLLGTHSALPPRDGPLALHPANPHYFLYRGKPAVLMGSTEHYGAVLNLDFDYRTYLATLQKDGMNLTRLFSGAYVENPNEFNIRRNTLAPGRGRYICPWARSNVPGYPNGGNKFDLTRWDDAYFKRLKDFCGQADRRGVVVEVVLFCPFYNEALWQVDPMNAACNVNGIGNVPSKEVYALKHPELTRVQEEMTRKLVRELNGFKNIYFEICNEPYFGGVTLEWQGHISQVIADTEASLPNRHLIAQNIANDWAKVDNPDPRVSIFNFHYASPPRAVTENYGLNKPISFDETGFKGTKDAAYRAQAWEFLLAGGAIFDHLDYSFSVEHPDGTDPVNDPTPGGGSPSLRRQLRVLREFVQRFDFLRMKPATGVVRAEPESVQATVLAEEGKQYAAYLSGAPSKVAFRLPAGGYEVEWIDTDTGKMLVQHWLHSDGDKEVIPNWPADRQDLAVRITRLKK